MNNKLTFTFAFITTVLWHYYVFSTVPLKQTKTTVTPQKKVSHVINLQRVSIKIPKPIEEIMPEPPKPVMPKVVPKPPKIEKKAIQQVQKKRKIVQKKMVKKKVAKRTSRTQLSAPKRKLLKESYMSKIRKIIEKHKKYPQGARRMRQEGVVKVKFTIRKNGTIKHVRLASKSTYSKLNKAAVTILKKITAFPPIPNKLGKNSLSLTVPIRYAILN